jgi:hypothetical protein
MFAEFLKEKKIYDEKKLKDGNQRISNGVDPEVCSDQFFDLFSAKVMQKRSTTESNPGDSTPKASYHAMKKNFKYLYKKPKSLQTRLKEFLYHG